MFFFKDGGRVMLGVYFSGTGNTAYCIRRLLDGIDKNAQLISIEDPTILDKLAQHEEVIFAYPIYYSNLPKLVRDFLTQHANLFHGKRVYILVTMGLFSGDGSGCAARMLSSFGAHILGGLHIKMPDCIADEKALKRSYDKNLDLIKKANEKIDHAVICYRNKTYTKEGLGFWYHLAGLFGQRLWFYGKTKHYSDRLHIDAQSCILCQSCIKKCPMQNLVFEHGAVIAKDRCTMCYRCINVCPKQSITLLGKRVVQQHHINEYLSEGVK